MGEASPRGLGGKEHPVHHTLWRPLAAATLALTLAACSDPGTTLDTVAPTTTAAAGTTITATTVADTTPSTDAPGTTVTTTEATTATTLALTDGPWSVVTSIPEVTEPGLYYELSLPGLYAYFPTKISDDDQVFWTMNEADRPVIEAYLHAQLTINESMLTRPMDFNLAGWTQYFEDGGAGYQEDLAIWNNSGQQLSMDLGIVTRPWVIDDDRTETEATIIDCVNDGSTMRGADGSLADGSFNGWGKYGYRVTMAKVDGVWKVRNIGLWEDGCKLFGP
jgi:hypothetical protein